MIDAGASERDNAAPRYLYEAALCGLIENVLLILYGDFLDDEVTPLNSSFRQHLGC